jgi:hypothetical protein
MYSSQQAKLLEVANLNRPPPVKMFLEEQNYKHNIEFNCILDKGNTHFLPFRRQKQESSV